MNDIDEKLVYLIEECSEVIQAATKCLRFGYDIDHGIGYGNNKDYLSREIGEVLGIISNLPLNMKEVDEAKISKMDRVLANKMNFPKNGFKIPLQSPTEPVQEFK